MKSLLKRIFIENWPRKGLSLILAIIIWFVVNQSLTSTHTISNVPVRIVNIPEGKTVKNMGSNGFLSKRETLTITGNKNLIDELTSNDIEVVFDASDHDDRWIATIDKKNIRSVNPEINISQAISKVSRKNILIEITKLVKEKVPVYITQPIGEAPKGYQFLDIWPYHLYISVSGPEDIVKRLKLRGIKLTFNLSDISKAQLDDLRLSSTHNDLDVVSFFVPKQWKQISLPILSGTPIEINDPDAKYLRIDFVRYESMPVKYALPVNLYFPPNLNPSFHPQKMLLATNDWIQSRNGIKIFNKPLYAKGVSELFLEIFKDMIEILVIVQGGKEPTFSWNVQFINHKTMEDRYVRTLMSDVSEENLTDLQPQIREEYLRNRFRNYMSRLQLFTEENQKLTLKISSEGNSITIQESNHSDSKKTP